jgi:hypothetical protein
MMGFSVRQKADHIGGFRFVSVYLMETLAGWVPTTPELEAKVLFGRHVWDFAQHADQLGRRTGELRVQLQYSHPPTPGYLGVLEALSGVEGTIERVSGFYDVLVPDLERRFREYVAATDPIDDEPSIRIIERILFDFARLRRDRADFALQRPDLAPTDAGWPETLRALADAQPAMVEERLRVSAAAVNS